MKISMRRVTAAIVGIALFASGVWVAAAFGPAAADDAVHATDTLRGFTRVITLSHVNDPATTPLFPGDPRFRIRHVFNVHDDGYYLEVIREGAHTGTHYSAPCHFHDGRLCMDDLDPEDLVLPAVVIDIRDEAAADPDHLVRRNELEAWEAKHGEMPNGAAVLLLTGCDRFWADGDTDGEPNYYNCGSGLSGDHQPGFARGAVKWLIETGVLAKRGSLGSDTFGPDPASDHAYMPTFLTLDRHRTTLENLTNLDELPPTGAWVALGSPQNVNGSGAPGTVFAFIP